MLKISCRSLSASLLLLCVHAWAEEAPTELAPLQVTATRLPESVDAIPASVTVVRGAELRARGAFDLRTALALVAGVEAPGGSDAGPAGSVPAFMGLREFDAFLLVVDNVPVGGAFNPQLTTLDLTNVERIEVMRGAAPVVYGATSFVGVIHVIHYAAGAGPAIAAVSAGRFGTTTFSAAAPLASVGDWRQSLIFNGENRLFSDETADVQRLHLLYRGATQLPFGALQVDADATLLNQDPTSPHPRAGSRLDPNVPLDANHNPSDAKNDERRYQLAASLASHLAGLPWQTTASFTYTPASITRGFLREDFEDTPPGEANADGFRQHRRLADLYLDSHVSHTFGALDLALGADLLYGNGQQQSANFEYFVPANGSDRPSSFSRPVDEFTNLADTRRFLGVYAEADYKIGEQLDLIAGLRLNQTRETRSGVETDDMGSDSERNVKDKARLSGTVGASWHVFRRGADAVTLFSDYRNSFKPAAVDFGPEAEADILAPETARAYEAGVKMQWDDGRLDVDLSGFVMNFDNLVVTENGRRVNAGREHLRGAEAEAKYLLRADLRLLGSYAYHSARFANFVQDFDGVPTQLRGNFLELAPRHLAGFGLQWAPPRGLHGYAVSNVVGSRFLNKRNTAKADGYVTVDASLGYRIGRLDLAVNGYNLSDRRDPVAESELGEAQFYRLSARSVMAAIAYDFN